MFVAKICSSDSCEEIAVLVAYINAGFRDVEAGGKPGDPAFFQQGLPGNEVMFCQNQ